MRARDEHIRFLACQSTKYSIERETSNADRAEKEAPKCKQDRAEKEMPRWKQDRDEKEMPEWKLGS